VLLLLRAQPGLSPGRAGLAATIDRQACKQAPGGSSSWPPATSSQPRPQLHPPRPQAPAAALLLRSLASQDAVLLACEAARSLRLEREPLQRQCSGPAPGDAAALVTTIWRFLGRLVRWGGGISCAAGRRALGCSA
jgi:hypothetical protein